MSKLTAKQEAFAILLASGKLSQSDAYRQAYNPGTTREASICERASRLANSDKVLAMVRDLQRETRAEVQLTRESYCRELLSLSAEARSNGAYSAAVSAMSAVGRCLGMNAPVDMRIEHTVEHSLSALTMEQLIRLASLPGQTGQGQAPGQLDFLEIRATALSSGPEDPAAPEE